MKIQKSDLPVVLPSIPYAFNSSITGVHSGFWSIGPEALIMGASAIPVESAVVAVVSDTAASSVSVFSVDAAGSALAAADTTSVEGKLADVKEKSTGNGGRQLWSLQA